MRRALALAQAHPYWLTALVAALAVLLYLALAAAGGGLGYPLDDAWIHQTYARNFVRSGRWEFVPGVVSAGSTSPLWTLLLAVGYAIGAPFLWWSYLLGALTLWGVAAAGVAVWRRLWPAARDQAWLPGVTLALTWPLVWAAGSGMETLLYAALGLIVCAVYFDPRGPRPHWLGLLSGLLVLVRPDGLVLVALVAAGLLLDGRGRPADPVARARRLLVFGLAALLPLAPYFLFNWRASGTVWPNTLYAKQVEYAVTLAVPLPARVSRLLFFSLGGPEFGWRGISGAHLLLLPGLIAAALGALRADWARRRLWQTLPLLWAGGHIFLYAWRLPVTYQHGRYLFAALPVWVLFGLRGWQGWWSRPWPVSATLNRLGRLAGAGTFAAMLLIMLLLGGGAYAADVAVIEGEMVAVAHWVRDHTPAEARVAAHDIGALGYFAERPLLDLAGLITPEIIPWLADERRLADYVRASDADYLVTAPGWSYPSLTAGERPLFDTGYTPTRDQGLNNMAVYALSAPE